MSKILKISLAAIAAAILGVGALWWFVIRSDAPPEAALPDRSSETTAADTDGSASDPTTTTTTASGGADGDWRVVPGDEVWVGYRVQEELGPNALHNTAVGRTPTVEGTLTIADSVVESVDVTADLTDLQSDKDRRDNRIRTDAIETDTFPFATFALTEPIELGEIPAIGEAVPATATGDLTIHGVTKTVELDLDARWNGDTIDVAGQIEIVFEDYEIQNPSFAGMVSVEDKGIMELQLTFERA